MNCWCILFCNKWWIIYLPPCFQQFDTLCVLAISFHLQRKATKELIDTLQLWLCTVSSRMDFRDHTLSYFERLSLYLKNNRHCCTGDFFSLKSFFSPSFMGESTHQHKQNLCIFTCITRNIYAVSQGMMDMRKRSFTQWVQVSCISISYEIN